MNRVKDRGKDLAYIFVIIVAVLMSCRPYLGSGFAQGSDGLFHLARIASIVDSVDNGVFPPKLRPILMKTYGYGVGFFYPDFFLYIPAAIMKAFNLEVILAYKIYHCIFMAVMGIIHWKCFDKLLGSRAISLLVTVFYISGNSYLMYIIYSCGAIGIFHALMLLPLSIVGILLIIDGQNGYALYGIGLIAVLLSHHLVFMMLMLVIFLMLIMNLGFLIKNPKVLGKIVGVSFLDMALSVAYWLPAMEQASAQKLKAMYSNIFSAQDNIMSIQQLLSAIRYPIWVLYVLSLLGMIVVAVKTKKIKRNIITINVSLIIMIWFACSRMIWTGRMGEVFSFFQETARFQAVIIILMILSGALNAEFLCSSGIASKFASKCNEYAFIIFGVVLSLVLSVIVTGKISTPFRGDNLSYISTYELLHDRYNGAGGEEFLPVETQTYAMISPETAIDNEQSSADGVKHQSGKWYEIWVLLEKEYYDMPYVYYKGYEAYLLDDNGNISEKLMVDKAYDDNGMLRVFMPEGREGIGHIMVTYRKTMIQKLAYILNLLVFIGFACVRGYRIIRKNFRLQK